VQAVKNPIDLKLGNAANVYNAVFGNENSNINLVSS
jgi:hypothetical protein